MKCVNCGGEVDSQAIKCPYCGSKNEEGIQFNKEVYEKVHRNKLLAPFLLKQQTPELIQKLLNKIVLAMVLVSVLLFVISTVLLVWVDNETERELIPGSYAEAYENEHDGYSNYYYWFWCDNANEFIDAWETGLKINKYTVWNMVGYAYDVMHDKGMDPELKEKGLQEIQAIFVDIMGFTEEEMALFEDRDDRYTYVYSLPEETRDKLREIAEEKLGNRMEEY